MAHRNDPIITVFDSVNHQHHTAISHTSSIINPVGNVPYVTPFGQDRTQELFSIANYGNTLDGDDESSFGL